MPIDINDIRPNKRFLELVTQLCETDDPFLELILFMQLMSSTEGLPEVRKSSQGGDHEQEGDLES